MAKDCLEPLISPITGRRMLEKGFVFLGNDANIEEPHLLQEGLPALGDGNIWVGNKDNVAEESTLLKDHYSRFLIVKKEIMDLEEDGRFILQKAHHLLNRAQALNTLAPGGIMKCNSEGVVSIANFTEGDVANIQINLDHLINVELPDINVQLKFVLEVKLPNIEINLSGLAQDLAEEITKVIGIETQLATLQTELAALQTEVAGLAASLAALQGQITALEATVAGLSAGLAALGLTVAGLGLSVASLQGSVSSLQSALAALQAAFDNAQVILVGDVIGVGNLNTAVVTKFASDPVFTGGAITLPAGDDSKRPAILQPGMVRLNTQNQL